MQIYLPIYEHIVDIHDAVLDVSGGRPGIRDKNIIKAAIDRPKTYLSYHKNANIHTVCAVLLDSIARNHAFVEGNKRTALMTAIITYELNEIQLQFTKKMQEEYEELVLWVVLDKPEISLIAERLGNLTTRYQTQGMSKFVERIRSKLSPFGD